MGVLDRFLKRFRRQNPEASRQVEKELMPMAGEEEMMQPKMSAPGQMETETTATRRRKRTSR